MILWAGVGRSQLLTTAAPSQTAKGPRQKWSGSASNVELITVESAPNGMETRSSWNARTGRVARRLASGSHADGRVNARIRRERNLMPNVVVDPRGTRDEHTRGPARQYQTHGCSQPRRGPRDAADGLKEHSAERFAEFKVD